MAVKKALCIFAVSICFFQLWGGPAYAGSLNENESELISIISGTYDYEGVTYKVKDLYIDMAIDYLMQDSIDLTNEQKQTAIQKMYSSVAQGITEGYLEAVEDAENDGEKSGVAGGQQTAPDSTEGTTRQNDTDPAGSVNADAIVNGDGEAKQDKEAAGDGETDAGLADDELEGAETADTDAAVKTHVILALESISQRGMQRKPQQQNESEGLREEPVSPVAGYPEYPWNVAWIICSGIFIGTVGCVGAMLKIKLFSDHAEKKRRGS